MFEFLILSAVAIGAYKLFFSPSAPATPAAPPAQPPAAGPANAPGAPAGTGIIPQSPIQQAAAAANQAVLDAQAAANLAQAQGDPTALAAAQAQLAAATAAAQNAAAAAAAQAAASGPANAPGAPAGTGVILDNSGVQVVPRPLLVGDLADVFAAEIPDLLAPPAFLPSLKALAATGDKLRVRITALQDPATGDTNFLAMNSEDPRIPLVFPLTLPRSVVHGPVV